MSETPSPPVTPTSFYSGVTNWPKVILVGLLSGTLCGLLPVFSLHVLRLIFPWLGQ